MAGYTPDVVSQDWCTPEWILVAVREAFGVQQIDLDPCSNDTSLVNARVEYGVPTNNGLEDSWDFPSAFVNPPYGTSRMHREHREFVGPKQWKEMSRAERKKYVVTSIAHWLSRCAAAANDHGSQVIALVPVTPETKGWLKSVWPQANGICFFDKRVKFIDFLTKEECPQVIPKPLAIIYWAGAAGDAGYERFEAAFSKLGQVIPIGRTLERLVTDVEYLRARVEDLESTFSSEIDLKVSAVDTTNASLLVFEGGTANQITDAVLARLREKLHKAGKLPSSASILVMPEGTISAVEASQIQTVIDRLKVLLPIPVTEETYDCEPGYACSAHAGTTSAALPPLDINT